MRYPEYTEKQADLSHGVVVIAIVFFAFMPFLHWPTVPWFAGIPAILGFFEAFIHIVGIKIRNLSRPYTPGMVTALLCLLSSVITIVMHAIPDIGAGGQALAAMCYFTFFGCTEILVWSLFGVDSYHTCPHARHRRKTVITANPNSLTSHPKRLAERKTSSSLKCEQCSHHWSA